MNCSCNLMKFIMRFSNIKTKSNTREITFLYHIDVPHDMINDEDNQHPIK